MAEIHCPLHEAARISRDEPALRWAGDAFNYYELDRYASGTAHQLHALGLKAGDRIGLTASGSWQSIVAFFGILRLGAVACPLRRGLPPAMIEACLAHVGAAALLAENETPGVSVRHVGVRDVVKTADRPLPALEVLRPELDRDATIVFTSGSSGKPKAVLHTVGNHYYSALGANHNIRIRSKQSWLLSVPFSHVSGIGILYRCLLSGAAIALPAPDSSLGDAVGQLQPTHLSLVPTQLARLLREEIAPEHLKSVLVGGGPVPAEWVAQAVQRRWPIFCTYGLTEMASQVTTEPFGRPVTQRGTAGAVLRHRQLRISEAGEILVRGQTLFKGYVEGDTIHRPLDDEQWFATGDLGMLDEEGVLTVHGRRDLQFVSGGENIQPEAIEAALAAVEGVVMSVVVPVAHAEYGQRPVAFVALADGAVERDQLPALLRECLPGYMVPDHFLPWPDDLEIGLKVGRSLFLERAAAIMRERGRESV
jgi:O-succinylbenzoic acid--CoA ligase